MLDIIYMAMARRFTANAGFWRTYVELRMEVIFLPAAESVITNLSIWEIWPPKIFVL